MLRSEFQSTKLKLQIVISVNSIILSHEEVSELEKFCDKLIYFSENLGGDTNINLGFVTALSEQADFLWILSANDLLLPGATKKILIALEVLKSDMLIISSTQRNHDGSLRDVFYGEGTEMPLGLISAVIYKCSVFRESFASALKFAWTGWGQLSVIQNALFEAKSLSFEIVDEKFIYERNMDALPYNQFKKNQSNYRHSFFGYPLVVTLLFGSDKRTQNKIIRHWLWNNWYKIGFFKKGHSPYLDSGETARDVFWTEDLARPLIVRSGLLSPLLFVIGNLAIISTWQDNQFFRAVKARIYPKQNIRAR
jgi:hypothetical protein